LLLQFRRKGLGLEVAWGRRTFPVLASAIKICRQSSETPGQRVTTATTKWQQLSILEVDTVKLSIA
jgi:hypothetical protein